MASAWGHSSGSAAILKETYPNIRPAPSLSISAKFASLHPKMISKLILHSPWVHRLSPVLIYMLHYAPGLSWFLCYGIKRLFKSNTHVRTFQSMFCNHNRCGDWNTISNLLKKQRQGKEGQHLLLMAGTLEAPFLKLARELHSSFTKDKSRLRICEGMAYLPVGLGALQVHPVHAYYG